MYAGLDLINFYIICKYIGSIACVNAKYCNKNCVNWRNHFFKLFCPVTPILTPIPSIHQRIEQNIYWHMRCIGQHKTNVFRSIYICHIINNIDIHNNKENIFVLFFHHVKSFYLSVKYIHLYRHVLQNQPYANTKGEQKCSGYVAKGIPKTKSTLNWRTCISRAIQMVSTAGVYIYIKYMRLCFFIYILYTISHSII